MEKNTVRDIMWDIDIEDAYEVLDNMSAKNAAEALSLPYDTYADMTTEERHGYAFESFKKSPQTMYELMGLPCETEVPASLGTDEEISDWLSEEFGFCHKGFGTA